jgi:chromosome segregation ATPase
MNDSLLTLFLTKETLVGLLSLAGILYVAWTQRELRHSQSVQHRADSLESSAGAVAQLTESLMHMVETLAGRDALIVELRARVEALEESDRRKLQRISELEAQLQRLTAERDALLQQLQARAA